ncbi:uncharacterized protein IUM83_00757 [Phytophthora cinnamomi]|uniref:uncharacterized protein n=1 Tax=Phytophthora cinnamomi TaxID=4785 RepID=UPI0035593F34|nr:hypothetical protein IUM83_00757 [Phytophthora cinnamomi]
MDPTPLTMDELARAVQLGTEYVMEHMSFRQVLELSYGAGGVYPTIAGYALGAISTLFFVRERKSLEWLLVVAAATGVCCTYVQLASLDLVNEHLAFKEMSKTKKNKKKHD